MKTESMKTESKTSNIQGDDCIYCQCIELYEQYWLEVYDTQVDPQSGFIQFLLEKIEEVTV